MKKLFYSAAVLGACLFLSSFSSVEKSSSYNEFTEDNSQAISAQFGSFVQFEESKETSDKTTWNKRHEKWTLTHETQEEGSTMQAILNRN